MSDWIAYTPDFALGVGLLYLPGLLCLLALRVPSRAALALSPAWSAGFILFAAVALSVSNLRFTLLNAACVIASVIVAVLLTGALLPALRPRTVPRGDSDPIQPKFLPAAAMGIGCLVAAVTTWWRSFGHYAPDVIAQQNDALFHSSGIWSILHSGDGSPLHAFSRMYGPESLKVVYPGVFHAFVALIADETSVIGTTKAFLFAICLAWYAGIGILTHALLPKSRWAPWIALIFTTFHPGFPEYLLVRVTIWPNSFAIALVPGAVASVVLAVRSAIRRCDQRGRTWPDHSVRLSIAAAGGLVAIGGSYMPVLFAVLIILTAMALGASFSFRGPSWLTNRPWVRGVLCVAPLIIVIAGAAAVSSNMRERLLESHSPSVNSPLFSLWSLVTQYPAGGGSLIFKAILGGFSVLVLISVVRQFRGGPLRPVAIAWCSVVLLSVSTLVPLPPLTNLTSIWYYGIYRIVPYTVMLSAPLAASEIELVARGIGARAASRWEWWDSHRSKRIAICAGLTVFATGITSAAGLHRSQQDQLFSPSIESQTYIAGAEEIALMHRIGRIVPKGQLVIGNPHSGSAYLPTVADTDVVYRQNGFGTAAGVDSDASVLANEFMNIHWDPKICRILKKHNVTYFYEDVDRLWNERWQSDRTPGFFYVDTSYGFEPVDRGGDATLYRITACDRFAEG